MSMWLARTAEADSRSAASYADPRSNALPPATWRPCGLFSASIEADVGCVDATNSSPTGRAVCTARSSGDDTEISDVTGRQILAAAFACSTRPVATTGKPSSRPYKMWSGFTPRRVGAGGRLSSAAFRGSAQSCGAVRPRTAALAAAGSAVAMRSIAASSCAADKNHASNALGGDGDTPASSMV